MVLSCGCLTMQSAKCTVPFKSSMFFLLNIQELEKNLAYFISSSQIRYPTKFTQLDLYQNLRIWAQMTKS